MSLRRAVAISAVFLVSACDRKTPEPPPAAAQSAPETAASAARTPATNASGAAAPTAVMAVLSDKLSRPAPERLVAIGDLHGDLDNTRRALKLAGAIDAKDAWAGGKMVVVQTGDEIDRGDGDRKILDYLEKLRLEAKSAGGELILLNGNHEVMNVQLDFRYVTPGAFAAFAEVKPRDPVAAQRVSILDESQRGRAAAFAPGGTYATLLADRPMMVRVGDTLFVHGGILPKHVSYGLDKMNDEVAAWMRGTRDKPPAIVIAEDGPVWTRLYSDAPAKADCDRLGEVLSSLQAKRMVVGHTVQKAGVTSACDERVWRIDTGMAHYFGGPVQEIEIAKDAVKVKKQDG